MLKKAANQSIKQQSEKLKERLENKLKRVDELAKARGIPEGESKPAEAIEKLLDEEGHPFWFNFKKAAPMLFCAAIEHNNEIKQVRDLSFMEELLKVRSMMGLMTKKLGQGDANIDIIEYSMATQMLVNKLTVLKSLNTTVEGDNDEKLTFNVQGTKRAVRVDLAKLREAITFTDNAAEENTEHLTKVEEIDISDITEDAFVEKVAELVGEVKKNENKTLQKETFIKIFKYTGDFAKLRSKGVKQQA